MPEVPSAWRALSIPVRTSAAAAAHYRRVLGIGFESGRAATIGDQAIRLAPATETSRPVVDLAGEPDSPALDVVRFGIRWRRRRPDRSRMARVSRRP